MIGVAHIGAVAAASQQAAGGSMGGVPHRYWRVLVTAAQGGAARVGVSELEFWDRRYARRAAGTYSESGATSGSGRAYDELRQTGTATSSYWVSNLGVAWLQIDAGAGNEFELAAVVIWRAGYTGTSTEGHIGAFDVQYSDDGSAWTTLWSVSDASIASVDTPRVFENPYYTGDPEPTLDPALSPLHWLKLDDGIFSDAGTTAAANNDGIAQATNHGSDGTPFAQPTGGIRPTYKTGGVNGKPFLRCAYASAQRFEDIAITQPSGFSAINPFMIAAVTDNIDPTNFPALLGSTATNGGKIGLYFRPTAGEQVHLVKTDWRFGNVANPQVLVAGINSYFQPVGVRINGVPQSLPGGGNLVSTAINAANLLWNDGLSGDGFFDGDLYELLYIPGSSTALKVFRLSEYLNGKYGGIY